MSLTASELGQLVEELRRVLLTSIVQKIAMPAADRVVLSFHTKGGRSDLLLCASQASARAHLLTQRPPNPEQAPTFCMLLRKHLDSARLSAIVQPEGDRRLQLVFQRRGEPAGSLEAELYGRAPNVFLLDPAGVILGRLLGSRAKGRENPLGERYVPPGPPPARPPSEPRFTSSFEAEQFFVAQETAAQEAAQRAARAQVLGLALKKAKRAREGVLEDQARAQEGLGERRVGELLLQNLHRLQRGAARAQVTDYSTGEALEIEVALDPALSPKENVERAFARYRRAERAVTKAGERLHELDAQIARLEDALSQLGTIPADALRAAASNNPPQPPPKKGQKPASALPYREFFSKRGDRIWVGKSAKDNDELTTRYAKGSDLWLHARDAAGSHVVIPLGKGGQAHQETLLDAAMLAVHFSKQRGEALVDVTYAPAKQVRKVKGTPGLVSVAGGKTLRVRMEEARLKNLFGEDGGVKL